MLNQYVRGFVFFFQLFYREKGEDKKSVNLKNQIGGGEEKS